MPQVFWASAGLPGLPQFLIPYNVHLLRAPPDPVPLATPARQLRQAWKDLLPLMQIFPLHGKIFNIITCLLPSFLNVVDIVSVDSLLIFKRIFAILWLWDGTAQVHIKKTIYKINITRTGLAP